MADPVPVALRSGKFFLRLHPDEQDAHHTFDNWFPVHFDRLHADVGAECKFEQTTLPNGRLVFRHPATKTILSADATEHGGDICAQFGGKPDTGSPDDVGPHEQFEGGRTPATDVPIVFVVHERDGEKYTTACLTVVEQ